MNLKRRLEKLEAQCAELGRLSEPEPTTQDEMTYRINRLFRAEPTPLLRFTGPQAVEVCPTLPHLDLVYATQMAEAFRQWFEQNPGAIYFPMTTDEANQALAAIDAGEITTRLFYEGGQGRYLTPIFNMRPRGDHTMIFLCAAIEGAISAIEAQTGRVIGRQLEHIEQLLLDALEGSQ